MQYGFIFPAFDALLAVDYAVEAEKAGWDGFFLWDHMLYSQSQKLRLYDPWVILAGIAMRTERLRRNCCTMRRRSTA